MKCRNSLLEKKIRGRIALKSHVLTSFPDSLDLPLIDDILVLDFLTCLRALTNISESMNNDCAMIGIDTAKSSFSIHAADSNKPAGLATTLRAQLVPEDRDTAVTLHGGDRRV